MQNQGILPELSNLDGLSGRAGGLPNGVTILRQSRRLYGCWPLKGAFSQPVESKSNRKSKNAEMQNQDILPELSNLDGLPGRAGGLPNGFTTSTLDG
jgi:hypothetical protein